MSAIPPDSPGGAALKSPALGGGLDWNSALEIGHPLAVIRSATAVDIPLILELIRDFATHEKLPDETEATGERLRAILFPAEGRPAAERLLAFWHDRPAGFTVFFPNCSAFLAKPGLDVPSGFLRGLRAFVVQ